MSAVVGLALVVQIVGLVLLRKAMGKQWLRRPAALLILASVVYQGLAPVLLSIHATRMWDIYRLGVQQRFVDSATLIMASGMLMFTMGYVLTKPWRANIGGPDVSTGMSRALDWRWMAAACAPLAVLTYEGRGYDAGVAAGSDTSLATNLASTFFITLVILASFSFLVRQGTRWFVAVLITQSLLLAAAGERSPVIGAAVALMVLLAYAGFRPTRRQYGIAGALTMATILAITGVRAAQGRELFYANTGLTQRMAALGTGLSQIASSPAGNAQPGLLAQAAVRLDGVDFGGAILQSVSLGQPRLSPTSIPESLLIVVPSAVWPSKLGRAGVLNPALVEANNFGLQKVNFLPGLPGLYMGFLSPPWLLFFLGALGVFCGWGERKLLAQFSAARAVILASALVAALSFEKGLPNMLVALRAGLVVAIVVKIIEFVLTRKSHRESAYHSAVSVTKLAGDLVGEDILNPLGAKASSKRDFRDDY